MKKSMFLCLSVFLFIFCSGIRAFGQNPIIVGHQHTDLSKIPASWILQAKSALRVTYGHTSHGSQLVSGLAALRDGLGAPYDYTFSSSGYNSAVFFNDYGIAGASDLGNPDYTTWATATRNLLNRPGGCNRNVVIWSWCGQADTTAANIQTYLDLMNQLEKDFPTVAFVYMTGHLVGSGVAGNLNQRNEQIRAFCRTNNKILFDFADIESYDPSGNYFLDKGAYDTCNYDGGNWAIEWLAANPGNQLSQLVTKCSDCAHSEKLNCVLKGRALWWLLARMAGWPGPTSDAGRKSDFNGDGQEDILWRFNGGGPWQGKNAVWYLSQQGGGSAMASGMKSQGLAPRELFPAPGPNKKHRSPLEAGGLLSKRPEKICRDALEAADILKYKGEWQIDTDDFKKVRIVRNPGEIGAGIQERIRTAGLVTSGSAYLETVADLNWDIAGTGDFSGDGKTDILWRYYGGGPNQGMNAVWYMNGANYIGAAMLIAITDTNWRIESTGDFNGDGKTDILWRYYGGGANQGKNAVWYMNGANYTGAAMLTTVTDMNWRIEGTGDFNGDGKTDILWRYYGGGANQGKNAVWYMNGTDYIGTDMLMTVTDTDWRIEGTGDFNGDGKTDIIWRYYGGDSNLGMNAVWYMNGANYIGAAMLDTVADANWRIKNR